MASSSISAGNQKKESFVEVLSELIIDFESLKENGFDLTEEIRAQKWERYFDRLVGPTFPMSDKPRHNVLGHHSKGGRLNPFREVIYGH